jgi:hypothetical protein
MCATFLNLNKNLKISIKINKIFSLKFKSYDLQTFVPLYSLAFAAVMLGIIMIAQFGPIFGQFLLLFFAFFNWLPVLNPLITILTIDDYRRGTIAIFKGQQQIQTTPIQPFVKSLT